MRPLLACNSGPGFSFLVLFLLQDIGKMVNSHLFRKVENSRLLSFASHVSEILMKIDFVRRPLFQAELIRASMDVIEEPTAADEVSFQTVKSRLPHCLSSL